MNDARRRKRCPLTMNARSGDCQAPGCDHSTTKRSRVCRCCVARLGELRLHAISLADKWGEGTKLLELEDRALEDLRKLGPNLKRHVYRGSRGVPLEEG